MGKVLKPWQNTESACLFFLSLASLHFTYLAKKVGLLVFIDWWLWA